EAKTASLPRRRTSAVPPVPEMLESSYDPMPRAVRPGRYAPAAARRYDDLVSDNQTISDTAVQAVVKNAIKTEHVEVFLQPIVRLPQRKVRFYEMFARVRAKP